MQVELRHSIIHGLPVEPQHPPSQDWVQEHILWLPPTRTDVLSQLLPSVTTPTPYHTVDSRFIECFLQREATMEQLQFQRVEEHRLIHIPGSPSGGTGASASGLSAGTYTVTVTDAHACIKTSTVSIVQPALLLSSIGSTALLCHGDATGTATVNASGGTTPYSYNWSLGGATSTTLSGLAAGNYSVTTTDARGCTTVSSVNVTEPAAVSSSVSTVSATCGSSNGSATVIPSGGTSIYLSMESG